MFEFDQPIPPAQGVASTPAGTVMLVDERTISQAEHTGLFFEAANGTTFIGSPTMGANGDVTLHHPGEHQHHVHGARRAARRRTPASASGASTASPCSPTIAGIRAGRDEVLEAALKYVGGTGEIPPDTVQGWRRR